MSVAATPPLKAEYLAEGAGTSHSTPTLQFIDSDFIEPNSSKTAFKSPPRATQSLGSQPWLQLDKYSKYFNVATDEVVDRIVSTARLNDAFVENLSGRTDYFGPIWITITLACGLFIATSIHHAGNIDVNYLSSLLTYSITYLCLSCFGGYFALRYLGADSIKASELTALTGYSLIIFYPTIFASLIGIAPLPFFIGVATATASAYFVYINLHPILRTSAIGVEKAFFYTCSYSAFHAAFLLSITLFFL